MASTVPRNPIDFDNPAAVRRFARMISIAILAGAGAFAALVSTMVRGEAAADAKEHRLYTPFVIAAAAMVLAGTALGSRMHTIAGPMAERCRKTLTLHIVSLALAEGAAFLGLILVLITKSWDAVLPAAIGFAGLATSVIRGEFRFSRLVEEAAGAS
jgi:hypothetical protein